MNGQHVQTCTLETLNYWRANLRSRYLHWSSSNKCWYFCSVEGAIKATKHVSLVLHVMCLSADFSSATSDRSYKWAQMLISAHASTVWWSWTSWRLILHTVGGQWRPVVKEDHTDHHVTCMLTCPCCQGDGDTVTLATTPVDGRDYPRWVGKLSACLPAARGLQMEILYGCKYWECKLRLC